MDVHRADPRRRATALVVVLVVLVAGVALSLALQRWFAAVAQLPAAVARAQLLAAFAWAAGSACAAMLWLAASLWRSGRRVRRAARWPLPQARVLRDTVVLRGGAAVARGRLLQGAGAALFACAACVAFAAWRVVGAFSAGA